MASDDDHQASIVYLAEDQLPEASLPDEAPMGAAREVIPLVLVGRKGAVGGRLAGEGGTNEIPGALGLRRGRAGRGK